jgi:hypothetical protein
MPPTAAIVGTLTAMCCADEWAERSAGAEVAVFERDAQTNRPLLRLAIKKYRRAAAAKKMTAAHIRPPRVLAQCWRHICSPLVMGRSRSTLSSSSSSSNSSSSSSSSNTSSESEEGNTTVPFAATYLFVRDRGRAIRQDVTVQRAHATPCVIRVVEQLARFLLLAAFELDGVGDFDERLNRQQLMQCLATLTVRGVI